MKWLNELEWIEGEVWGNIWQTECIARVSPVDGKVLGWILMDGLTQVRLGSAAFSLTRYGVLYVLSGALALAGFFLAFSVRCALGLLF